MPRETWFTVSRELTSGLGLSERECRAFSSCAEDPTIVHAYNDSR